MRTDPNPLPTVLARLLLAVADDLASVYNNAPGGPFEHRMPLDRVFPRDSTGLLYEGTFMKALRGLSASSITARSLWKALDPDGVGHIRQELIDRVVRSARCRRLAQMSPTRLSLFRARCRRSTATNCARLFPSA